MIAAIVPAKALDRAKGRLAALLSEAERRELSLAMLEDVLKTLQAVPSLDLIAVVSPDREVLALARELGAEAIPEPASVRGINQALSHAVRVLSERPIDALLVLLADVPAVAPADIASVLGALPPGRGVVLCPSHDKGTSAMALRPPDAIPFRFGPHSFPAHKREAAARGIPAGVLRIPSLARDIDEPDDLCELLSHPAETATQRLLARLRLGQRVRI